MRGGASLRSKWENARRQYGGDPWESASPKWRKKRTAEFQNALSNHLPGLSDAAAAERELRALLSHEPIETIRSAEVKRALNKIRQHLEAIAKIEGALPVLQELFHRRRNAGRDWELLAPVVECVFMLQVWPAGGVDNVLKLFENEAAAEIATYREQGKTKWGAVWAIDALIALWSRQTGKPWTSKTVKWEGVRARGVYLREGYNFLAQAFDLDGSVEPAFNRWVELRGRPKVV